MAEPQKQLSPQTVRIAAGAQVIINGALVTASTPCTLQVGSGACVLSGRALWREGSATRNPRDELYFSLLDCSANEGRFDEDHFRLFRLLGEVVAQDRTHDAQRECAMCAAALIAGDCAEALESAARLASKNLVESRRRERVPGQKRKARSALNRFTSSDHQERGAA